MYYFYGKVNQGHIVCPLYGDGPYLRESIMGGSTVHIAWNREGAFFNTHSYEDRVVTSI